MEPRLLLSAGQMRHDFHQIAHHFFADAPHQGGSFFRNADHDLAPVFARTRTHHVPKILEPRHQTARCRGRMSHFLRDRGHGEDLLVIERGQKKKLRKRYIAGRQFLAETQDETALHLQDNMGEPLCIGAELVNAVQGELSCGGGGGLQRA